MKKLIFQMMKIIYLNYKLQTKLKKKKQEGEIKYLEIRLRDFETIPNIEQE